MRDGGGVYEGRRECKELSEGRHEEGGSVGERESMKKKGGWKKRKKEGGRKKG